MRSHQAKAGTAKYALLHTVRLVDEDGIAGPLLSSPPKKKRFATRHTRRLGAALSPGATSASSGTTWLQSPPDRAKPLTTGFFLPAGSKPWLPLRKEPRPEEPVAEAVPEDEVERFAAREDPRALSQTHFRHKFGIEKGWLTPPAALLELEIFPPGRSILCLSCHPEREEVLVGGEAPYVAVYSMLDGKPKRELTLVTPDRTTCCVCFLPDGGALAGGVEGGLCLFKERSEAIKLEAHAGPISQLLASEDGAIGVSGSHDRTIRVWNLVSGSELFALEGHMEAVLDVAWASNCQLLVSTGRKGEAIMWDLREDSSHITDEREEAHSTGWLLQDASSEHGAFTKRGEERPGPIPEPKEPEPHVTVAHLCRHNGVHIATGNQAGELKIWDEGPIIRTLLIGFAIDPTRSVRALSLVMMRFEY